MTPLICRLIGHKFKELIRCERVTKWVEYNHVYSHCYRCCCENPAYREGINPSTEEIDQAFRRI